MSIIKLLIFLMIFSKVQVQFRIRIHNLELRIRIHNLEFWIRILQKFRILADPDPQQWCILLIAEIQTTIRNIFFVR
jgi:hypothetical protein